MPPVKECSKKFVALKRHVFIYCEDFELPHIGPRYLFSHRYGSCVDVRFANFNDLESVKAQITDRTCAIITEVVQGEGDRKSVV